MSVLRAPMDHELACVLKTEVVRRTDHRTLREAQNPASLGEGDDKVHFNW